DFSWFYNGKDPRTADLNTFWTSANSCASPITKVEADVAFNGRSNLYVSDENPWPSDVTPYADDPIKARFDLLLPHGVTNPTTGGPVDCATVRPIPTGVCVRRSGGIAEYPDAVCPNPGCHYVPAPAEGSCSAIGSISGSCAR
ncbi:MAG TPA: hypothetical protein VIG74_06875, partial [Alphaproteobacteria bacterium]